MKRWMVLDYGVGNLHSIVKALERAGAQVAVTQDPRALGDADVAVLPGVGAFGAVMQKLAPAAGILRARHADRRPTLGVCIGAQVLYEASEETPAVKGLGILPGTVQRLPASAGKVPHMGWNTLDPAPPGAGFQPSARAGATPGTGMSSPVRTLADDPLFAGVPDGSHVYYVHGYAAAAGPEALATTRYGTVFTAALREGNTVGVQFHPEKSGAVGARILTNAVRQLEGVA